MEELKVGIPTLVMQYDDVYTYFIHVRDVGVSVAPANKAKTRINK